MASFFDLDNPYAQMIDLRDLLIELNRVINWASIHPTLLKIAEKPRKNAVSIPEILK